MDKNYFTDKPELAEVLNRILKMLHPTLPATFM